MVRQLILYTLISLVKKDVYQTYLFAIIGVKIDFLSYSLTFA